jgi:parallel beta-helix repeat protein
VTRTTAFTLGVTVALTVATPTITPNGGSFSDSVTVAMQTLTSGASIYYTTDGSTPTQTSALYSGAMTVTNSARMNAKAFTSGSNSSADASAAFSKAATGVTYYVAKNGNDSNTCAEAQNIGTSKQTINAGIRCLASGDTLRIRRGTYVETVGGPNNGTSWPSGSAASRIIIEAYPGETVIVQPSSSLGQDLAWQFNSISASNVIQYITVRSGSGKLILDGKNVTVYASGTNESFGRTGAGLIMFAWNGGELRNIRIQGLEIRYFGGDGIFGGGTDVEVLDNDVHHNGDTGGNHGWYGGGRRVLARGNSFHHNGGYGIHWYGHDSIDSEISRNLIYNNGNCIENGWRSPGRGCSDCGAIVINPVAYQSRNVKIHNNVIYNEHYGIDVKLSSNSSVYGNTFYNFNRAYPTKAVGVVDALDLRLANNIFALGYNVVEVSSGPAPLFSNNLCFQVKNTNGACAESNLGPLQ